MKAIKKRIKERLFYKIVVTDKNRNIVTVQEKEAHSFLVQYNELLSACFDYASRTIKDNGGTDRSISPTANAFKMDAAIGVVLQGIRVGSGNTAVAVGDYALETPIAEGTGAGQMSYQVQTLPTDVTVSDPDCTFPLKRIIINNSSGSITVREIGIYCRLDATIYYGCIARDVITSVAVPAGGAITVTYTWKISE